MFDRLKESDWRYRQSHHRERLAPYAHERVARMAEGQKHPTRDFLFEYYSFRPAQLMRWSPGADVLLENARSNDLHWTGTFEELPDGLILPSKSFPHHRLKFINWTTNYLRGVSLRTAFNGCFGLHEWAMVYRETNIRHGRTPLRLTADRIAEVVESHEVCCTHYDAFRFFTPLAAPRNRHHLTRELTDLFDQPGCVHVTMDLYRFAYKIAPWVAGELMADAFLLAWDARELDMRASPYDMREFGLEPILIEEAAGRQEYVRCQQLLTQKAEPIRTRLLKVYEHIQANCAVKTI